LGKEGGEGVVDFETLIVVGIERKEKNPAQCSRIHILSFLSKMVF